MLSHRERKLRLGLLLADGGLAAASLLAASALYSYGPLRAWAEVFGGSSGLASAIDPSDLYVATAVAALGLPVALDRFGAYAASRRQGLGQILLTLVKGSLAGAIGLAVLGLAFRLRALSLPVLGLYALICPVSLGAGRIAILGGLRELRRRGYNLRHFVVIGSGERARGLAQRIAANPGWGLRNLGFLDDEPRREAVRWLGDRYLGKAKELGNQLRSHVIDEVIIALPRRQLCADSTAEAVALCEAVGVDVTVATDLFQTQRSAVRPHGLLGVAGLTVSSHLRWPLWSRAIKRAIDLVGASVLLLLTGPFWILIAIAIKLDSPGPVFYVQRRCGLNGRVFAFLKFRTMERNAEEHLGELREYNEVTGPVFKMKRDPRVTRVGRFLRKWSIDEWPQFLNVAAGHMSLVGPRPPVQAEVDQYELAHRRRLSVRPGLTCLWQVRGRSGIPFDEWMRLDLEYIDRWSLWLDLWLLLLTVPAVLSGRGAS
jgi:exopolysaccharide biosynthesis polyprenyl glycosylphosphotransferase